MFLKNFFKYPFWVIYLSIYTKNNTIKDNPIEDPKGISKFLMCLPKIAKYIMPSREDNTKRYKNFSKPSQELNPAIK